MIIPGDKIEIPGLKLVHHAEDFEDALDDFGKRKKYITELSKTGACISTIKEDGSEKYTFNYSSMDIVYR